MVKAEKSKENIKKCICMKCPSYSFMCKIKGMPVNIADIVKKDLSKTEHMEALYCAFEKSNCIDTEKGCICGNCAVFKESGLEKLYYCLNDGGK
jgi:hypothetical protein